MGAEHEPMIRIPGGKDFERRLADWPPQSGAESTKAA